MRALMNCIDRYCVLTNDSNIFIQFKNDIYHKGAFHYPESYFSDLGWVGGRRWQFCV